MGGPQVQDSRANLFLTLFPALSVLWEAVWPLVQFEDVPALEESIGIWEVP